MKKELIAWPGRGVAFFYTSHFDTHENL